MAPRVWVVAVNYNGLEDTRKCLRSLAGLSDPASAVVVDNASKEDPTAALAAESSWAHLVRNPVNGGWSGGNNTGIRYALPRRGLRGAAEQRHDGPPAAGRAAARRGGCEPGVRRARPGDPVHGRAGRDDDRRGRVQPPRLPRLLPAEAGPGAGRRPAGGRRGGRRQRVLHDGRGGRVPGGRADRRPVLPDP